MLNNIPPLPKYYFFMNDSTSFFFCKAHNKKVKGCSLRLNKGLEHVQNRFVNSCVLLNVKDYFLARTFYTSLCYLRLNSVFCLIVTVLLKNNLDHFLVRSLCESTSKN